MGKNKRLEEFETIIRECVKCGACQAHCPAYLVSKKEGAVARGKIALAAALLDGDTGLEDRLDQDIGMCLMCGSCTAHCPNSVPTPDIVGAIRRKITDNKGLTPMKRGISSILGSQSLMRILSKGGALLSPLALKEIPKSSGMRLRFPLPFSGSGMEDRTVPKPALNHLFEQIPEFIQGKSGKPVVGFFAGCSLTYIYPHIGKQMVTLLSKMGYSVYTPKAQGCCGIPALSSGLGKQVETLCAQNINAFSGQSVDVILTACASCNGGIKEYYATMTPDKNGDNSLKAFTNKVMDFSVFLEREGLFETLSNIEKWPEPTTVTWHDPCHLKIQGITKAPRQLLKALPNVTFVEMEGASQCCGLGGTFSVHHYEESKAIGARKIAGLQESGASKVVTACPGCMIQLQDSINHAGLSMEAIHLLELLTEALSGSN